MDSGWDDVLKTLVDSLGYPPATYERVKEGSPDDGISIHGKIFFVRHEAFEWKDLPAIRFGRHRFLIVMSGGRLFFRDAKTQAQNDAPLPEVYRCAEILRPLIGDVADVSANREQATIGIASKIAELYHLLKESNSGLTAEDGFRHMLCLMELFFLEGEGLLGEFKTHEYLVKYGAGRPEETGRLLANLYSAIGCGVPQDSAAAFEKLTSPRLRRFSEALNPLTFNRKSHDILVDISARDWSGVDVAILGGIVQCVADPKSGDFRQILPPQDYIEKMLGPLFMDSLTAEFARANGNAEELASLSRRIDYIKIFDPSCSFGAILTGAYERLASLKRKIEDCLGNGQDSLPVRPESIYGIDPNPCSLEVAKLSFEWIFYRFARGGKAERLETAKDGVSRLNLLNARAPREDWMSFCPPAKGVYIISNPPYVGARKANKEGKEDKAVALAGQFKKEGELDLATCWLYLGCKHVVAGASACALMTTNSLVQGVHCSAFWPKVLETGCRIAFAYEPFKLCPVLSSNAPTVTSVILGISHGKEVVRPRLVTSRGTLFADEISPYLIPGHTIVRPSKNARSPFLPKMNKGNMPYGKQLVLNSCEKYELLAEDARSAKFIKKLVGSEEFIHENPRWCIWVHDHEVEEALSIPPIARRIESQRKERLSNKNKSARKLGARPWSFRECRETTKSSLVIPAVSSENREYIPIGFISSDTIVTNLSFVIYECPPWLFGLLTSRMHNLWIRTVCGGLETRIRYSNEIGYNTFPVPKINDTVSQNLTVLSRNIIHRRGCHPELTLGELYDNMPADLRLAHAELDAFVENLYRPGGFKDNLDRISFMMQMYEGGV